MSRSIIKKILMALTPLLLMTFIISAWLQRPVLKNEKPEILRSQFSSEGNGYRIVKIELDYTKVTTNKEAVEVKAFVTMPFSYNEKLKYRWRLGQDVELIAGALEGELENLIKGEAKIISLKVKGFSFETNRHIRLEVVGQNKTRAIYGDALIASDIENTFENTVQNVEHIKANQ